VHVNLDFSDRVGALMRSFLKEYPGRGSLTHKSLMRELSSMKDSWADFCHETLDYKSWFDPVVDPKLSDHQIARQWRHSRKGIGNEPLKKSVLTEYRMAMGYENLEWSFVGEVLRGWPDGYPERLNHPWCKLNGGEKQSPKDREFYIRYAKRCIQVIQELHEENLRAYGYPPPVGRGLAIQEWGMYIEELPKADEEISESKRATWPNHWCQCETSTGNDIEPAGSVENASSSFPGVPSHVIIPSSDNNMAEAAKQHKRLKKKHSAVVKDKGPPVRKGDTRLVYFSGQEPYIWLAQILRVSSSVDDARPGLGRAATNRVPNEAITSGIQLLSQVTKTIISNVNGEWHLPSHLIVFLKHTTLLRRNYP
jgi:hypothetical protein